jgi:dolichol kinase
VPNADPSRNPEAGESRLQPELSPTDTALTVQRELTRKGLHLLSAAVPIAYSLGLSRNGVTIALACALVVALVVEVARARHEATRTVFDARLGRLLRVHETQGFSGATWLIVALLSAALLFPRDIAIAAMGAVAVGDAAAAIVGRALTRRHGEGKSLAGTLACLAASAIMARGIADFTWPQALIAGILAAIAERPTRPLDDNLRIALAVGCGILLWRMGFS